MDRSHLLELKNKFARLDDLFCAFQREPRPLEDFEGWRERFQALYMQLATLDKYPGLTKQLAIAPLLADVVDNVNFYEAILRTRPDEKPLLSFVDEQKEQDKEKDIDKNQLCKRAEILLANLTPEKETPPKVTSTNDQGKEGERMSNLIKAIKAFY